MCPLEKRLCVAILGAGAKALDAPRNANSRTRLELSHNIDSGLPYFGP